LGPYTGLTPFPEQFFDIGKLGSDSNPTSHYQDMTVVAQVTGGGATMDGGWTERSIDPGPVFPVWLEAVEDLPYKSSPGAEDQIDCVDLPLVIFLPPADGEGMHLEKVEDP
jgi:hypothetical protein